jgi:prolyl oligopeptidase
MVSRYPSNISGLIGGTAVGPLLFGTTALASLSWTRFRSNYLNNKCGTPAAREGLFRDSSPNNVSYWLKREKETDFLEEIRGEKALAWVRGCNQVTTQTLGLPKEEIANNRLYSRILSILNNDDKIPYVSKIGTRYYNIWKDKTHKHGLIRRTTLESYRTTDPVWETVLDIDELCKTENENWVFSTWTVYEPDNVGVSTEESNGSFERILLHLSRGGSDAVVIREFDLKTLKFIDPNDALEPGFYLTEGKSNAEWKSPDVLLVGADVGEQDDLTPCGYPRKVREWQRGTDIKEAKVVFTGGENDVVAYGSRVR